MLKQNLDLAEAAKRNLEMLAVVRNPPPKSPVKNTTATKIQVRRWLQKNALDYDNPTSLAEAANVALDLPFACLDDPDHWLWDEAFNALEKYNPEALG